MIQLEQFREPMDMPDPYFPIKLHLCKCDEIGKVAFRHHWHKHLEILYILTGTGRVTCNSNAMTVHPGEFVIINSNDLHYGVSLSEHLSYYALIADPSLLHSHNMDAVETKFITPIVQNQILFQHHIKHDKSLEQTFLSLVQELQQKPPGYELAIKSQLYGLMTRLFRQYVVKILDEAQQMQRLKNLEQFSPVFQYIDNHYAEKITVQKLADLAGLSRYHFSRLFKKLTNRTVVAYIHDIRLHKSEYLLRYTPMNVSEVAMAVGFNDIYYFSRSFKRHKHLPPSAYKNETALSPLK